MARYKLDIQKRQHRERSQPLNRARLGLLEKHKDYVKRAKDYHSKQDRIKKLREKASLKNPDEFYFEMINSRTEKGVHIKSRGNKALDNDLVVLLKTQDFNYVKTCRTIEERKVEKIKEQLGSMVNAIGADGKRRASTRQDIINLLQQSTSATAAHKIDDDESGGEDGPLPVPRKKTIFVDSVQEVRDFGKKQNLKAKTSSSRLQVAPPRPTPSPSISSQGKSSAKGKSKATSTSAEDIEKSLAEQHAESEAHVARLVNSLKSRLTRLRTLQRAERELELKRALMGNGSKFLKNAPVQKKPLPNGRDLSWYDKLDRNELIEEQDEKERSEKLNAGIKTGAKVWKWKAERKR